MNSFCLHLNIPVNFLKEDFNKEKYSNARQQAFDRSEISKEYLNWIESLGLILGHAEVFYSIPNNYYPIHQDQYYRKDFPKINFIYGGDNSFMNWYKVKPEVTGTILETSYNSPYVKYHQDEVELLYSTEIKSSSLIQAGVPHNVTISNAHRWCISTVYLFPNKRFIKWADAEKIFESVIIKT